MLKYVNDINAVHLRNRMQLAGPEPAGGNKRLTRNVDLKRIYHLKLSFTFRKGKNI